MNQSDYLAQAIKYREVAAQLDFAHRGYYLKKAAEFEALAAACVDSEAIPERKVYQKPKLTKATRLMPSNTKLGASTHVRIMNAYKTNADKPGQHKEYWLSRARYHEGQARKKGATLPTPAVDLSRPVIGTQTKMHSGLALTILKGSYEGAFRIWLTARPKMPDHRHWFDYDDLVKLYAELTGKHPGTIKRWLDKGDGVLFTIDEKRRVFIRGLWSVCSHFGIEPGRVVLVDTDKLLGKLDVYRATLESGWMNGKESKWAARSTRRKISRVSERGQRNYDKALGTRVKHSKRLDRLTDDGKPEQGINRYFAVNHARYHGKRPAHHTSENNVSGNALKSVFDVTGEPKRRLFFDNPRVAEKTAKRRAKQGEVGSCFMVMTTKSDVASYHLKELSYDVYSQIHR